MQSFLQYWNIRERLEKQQRQQQQQERDVERTAALSVLEEAVEPSSESNSTNVTKGSEPSTGEADDVGKLDIERGLAKTLSKRVCLVVPKAQAIQTYDASLSPDDASIDGSNSRPPTPPPKHSDYRPKTPEPPRPPRPPKRLRIRTGSAQSIVNPPPAPPPFCTPITHHPSHPASSLNLHIQLTYHPFPRPSTVGGAKALGVLLSGITVQTHPATADGQVFVVEHEEGGDDPLDPHTWSIRSRIAATLLIGSIAFVVGVASSINSSVAKEVAREFGVSEVVATLATGRYLVGLGIGALFSGPFSETLGRNPVYVGTLSLYMVCIAAAGMAPNAGAQIAFRFLAGFFGSTPLTCAGGSIADLWSPLDRVYAFPVFANAAFLGPVLGPILGSFIATSPYVDWRWVEWTSLILSAVVLLSLILFQPETYAPVLLRWKAHHLRALTRDDRYVAAVELAGDTFCSRLRTALYRPFVLTATEPIIGLIGLYLTVIYVILFMFLDGFDYVFGRTYGTSAVVTAFCFCGIAVGLFGATALAPLVYYWAKRGYVRRTPGAARSAKDRQKAQKSGVHRQGIEKEQEGGPRHPLPPEFRLWYAMLGGSISIPVSLFWMGWTSRPAMAIWSPLAASVVFGYGILCVFVSSYLYMIDTYATLSASALASVTLVRYVAAGAMVSVGMPFYERVGVPRTLSILGGVAALLAPLPYVFYLYGERIRGRSWWAGGKEAEGGEAVTR